MTAKRAQNLMRIVRLQSRIHEVAELRLKQTEAEKRRLEGEQDEIIAALNGDDGWQHLFVVGATRRLSKLAHQVEIANRARIEQNQRLVEEGRRLKLAERLSTDVQRKSQKSAEKAHFEALLATLAGSGKPSLP